MKKINLLLSENNKRIKKGIIEMFKPYDDIVMSAIEGDVD